ncbi:hypothetical protein [Xenorhabdus sp. PB30.3]|nr:hypothetical protein [Xenorhabdus sp. PB30.3]
MSISGWSSNKDEDYKAVSWGYFLAQKQKKPPKGGYQFSQRLF